MKVVELEPKDRMERLLNQLEQVEKLLRDIRQGVAPSMGARALRAAITAFASVLGAAVLLAIAAAILQPFTRLEIVGDRVDRILNTIEKKDRK